MRASLAFLKKRLPPLGLSKKRFFKKLSTPGARKPWQQMKRVSDGVMDIEPSIDRPQDTTGQTLMPQVVPHQLGHQRHHIAADSGSDGTETMDGALSASLSDGSYPLVFHGRDTHSHGMRPVAEDAPEPIASLPFGHQLDLNVTSVSTNEAGAVPSNLQSFRRTAKERSESLVLPKHINQLFHKIMGWSDEAVRIDENHPLVTDAAVARDPLLPQRRYEETKQKLQYGVLLDDYEKDKFAVEQNLRVAGEKFEKQFLGWEGLRLLDNDAAQAFQDVRETKGSLVIQTANTFRIPIVNRDPCPGCGATLQDKDEHGYGFVQRSQIEHYIQKETDVVRLRTEYADRMAELQTHWEKHGRRVGEEWLDFMTQEEFNAIYRHVPRSFVCHRCNALENLGVEGRKKVMSAPDFTEQLRALKEQTCVVVLVVDITDFPGSMVYDLPGLISMNNKVILAVNKCDCLRMRSFSYKGKDVGIARRMTTERYIKSWVRQIATSFGLPNHQIIDVVPVSANRGWNIDLLLSTIEEAANLNLRHRHKPLKTYFVGVANVGKSSLINAIAHHLYVPQPPHPKSKKVYYAKTGADGKETVHWRWYTPPNVNRAEMIDIPSRHCKVASKLMTVSSLPGTTVAANAVRISLTGNDEATTFLFDTPGLFPHWLQTSPLTLHEMRRTLIRRYRNPVCYVLLPGHTLFLGGLAAIDVVKGTPMGLLMMVYTSHKVKSAIVNTEASDAFWAEHLGTAIDPPGSLEQLGDLRLTVSKSYLFECFGKHRLRPKADVYVCGLGWVSFCVGAPCDVVIRVRTLPGVVHGVREPLRPKDLRGWNRWPNLINRFKAKAPGDSVDKVIRLTAKELSPSDEKESPLKLIERAKHPKHTASSADPFAETLSELERHGKL